MAAISSRKISSLVRRSGYQLVLIILQNAQQKQLQEETLFSSRIELQSLMAGNGRRQWDVTMALHVLAE